LYGVSLSSWLLHNGNKDTCTNMTIIGRLDLEARILDALKQRLMEPQLFALL